MKKERQEAIKKAMPEVKTLVKKYGRTIVQACVTQLQEYERKCKELERMKRDTEKLEKELNQ